MKRLIMARTYPAFVGAVQGFAEKFQIAVDVVETQAELIERVREDKDLVAAIWAGDGLHAVKQVRAVRDRHARNLVFVIVAPMSTSASQHRAMALNAGADDCQTWPIDGQEFVERYWSICRRERRALSLKIRFRDLEFDPETGAITTTSGLIQFPRREGEFFHILASRPDQVVPHDLIMWQLFGKRERKPHHNVCKVLICNIRKRLFDASGGLDFIESVWGRGYRFDPLGFEPNMDTHGKRRVAG